MDEVLVETMPEMYRLIRMNWKVYHKWFKDFGPLTEEEIAKRKQFKIKDWLLKDEIKAWPEEKRERFNTILWNNLNRDVFSHDFYRDLQPTKFAQRTLMNSSFIDHIRVNKVYILTSCVNEEIIEYKRQFIKRYFHHPKIEFVPIPYGKKKSDIVKEKNISWNIFVDDEIKNIKDFIENLNIDGKEFLIPYFGYNDMPPILDLLIREKNAVFNYYERI